MIARHRLIRMNPNHSGNHGPRTRGYRFMPLLLTEAIIVFAALSVNASLKPSFGEMTGFVTDAKTGHAIPGSAISIINTSLKTVCDSNGRFHIEGVPVGYCDITIAANGYLSRTLQTHLVEAGINRELFIGLDREYQDVPLDKMTITTSRLAHYSAEQSNSVDRISREEILNTAGSFQDPVRILQTMASTVGDGSSNNTFLVRGGTDNENVFLLDGIEVENLSHWGTDYGSSGPISFLHPDFIQSMDFYAGAAPVRCPPKLSSVTDITLREGSRCDRLWQFDFNMAGAAALLEGPIVQNKSSYMLDASVSFLDLVQPFLQLGGLPKYQNVQTKLTFDLDKDNKLTVNAIAGHDQIDIISSDGINHVKTNAVRGAAGIKLLTRALWGQNTAMLSGRYNDGINSSTLQDSISQFRWRTKDAVVGLEDNLTAYFRIRDEASIGVCADLKDQFDTISSDNYYLYARLKTDSAYFYALHPQSEKLLDSFAAQQFKFFSKNPHAGGYGSYTAFVNILKLTLGLRDDYYALNRKQGLSPRASIAAELPDGAQLSISGGTLLPISYVSNATHHVCRCFNNAASA